MQVHLVTSNNISRYTDEIETMHKHRKAMFVDRLKWSELETYSSLEIDEFDHKFCNYLLLLDENSTLLGSCRLTPTNKPNVTTDILAEFFDGNPLRSEKVWEVSRWLPAPGIKELNEKCNKIMMLALFEFGHSHGLTHMISCVGRIVTSAIARAGVPIDKMYKPRKYPEGIAFGIEFIPSAKNLETLRASFGITNPVIVEHSVKAARVVNDRKAKEHDSLQNFPLGTSKKVLTDALDEDGAVIINDAIDPVQLQAELSYYFDQSKPSKGAFYGFNTKRIGALIKKSETCRDLAINETILDLIEHSLGENCDKFQLNLSQGIQINPGESAQFLHRDDAMFPTAGRMESMINVIIAVTDFKKENGATRLIPGSHKWEADQEPNIGDTVYAEMKAGSCLVYRGSVLHAGSENTSQAPRIGAVISYSLGWLKQAENFFLSIPWEEAQHYPKQLQRLLGYQLHRPNLGWVEGIDPLEWLNKGKPSVIAAKDALPPEMMVIADLALDAPEKFSAYLE